MSNDSQDCNICNYIYYINIFTHIQYCQRYPAAEDISLKGFVENLCK